MTALLDLNGKRFGRLVVTGPHVKINGKTWWPCRCDCGTEAPKRSHSLVKGITRSCGCLHREVTRSQSTKHGMAGRLDKAPEYKVWSSMMDRGCNPRSTSWANYGARGITVCERWRDFTNFFRDMGPRPSPDHELDRIDNERGYEPGNVRWTTRTNNCNNRRSNRRIVLNGRSQTLADWSRETGLDAETIRMRLKRGWTVQRALTAPLQGSTRKPDGRLIDFDGRNLTLAQWSRETGLDAGAISRRLARGWTVERVLATPSRRSEG